MAKSNSFLNYPYPGNSTKNIKPRVFASGRDQSLGVTQQKSKVFQYDDGVRQFNSMQKKIREEFS